jgi:hypothetical protein
MCHHTIVAAVIAVAIIAAIAVYVLGPTLAFCVAAYLAARLVVKILTGDWCRDVGFGQTR